MRENLTEMIFILDKSGSMRGLESDTIGGFNAMIEKQKKADGTALVSTILFDHQSVVVHDRADINTVQPLTDKEYCVGGTTALLDAVGGAIHHIGIVHKYARPEDVPEHTVFVITTDGMENSSHTYTAEQVKALVEQKKEENHWEFLFLGANIDAVSAAATVGISEDRAVDYCCDSAGTQLNFSVVGEAISSLRCKKPLSREWKAPIEADYKKRRK